MVGRGGGGGKETKKTFYEMGARQRTRRKDYKKAWKKNVNVKDDCSVGKKDE